MKMVCLSLNITCIDTVTNTTWNNYCYQIQTDSSHTI